MKRFAQGALSVALLAGCGAAPSSTPTPTATLTPTASPSPTASPDTSVHLVVLGDSIPFAAFCDACTGFVAQYATELQTRFGRAVTVANRSRDDSAGMTQIEDQLSADGTLKAQIAVGDVVIVSVGYNNVMPDPATWAGCVGEVGGDNIDTYIRWVLALDEACLQTGLDAFASQYDRIFSAITAVHTGRPALYVAINVHDGNLGNPDFKQATVDAATRAAMDRWLIRMYDRWNEMLCGKAKAHGFACLDVYHVFNGAGGNATSEAWTVDFAHPSQLGADLISKMLARLDTSMIAN